MDRSVRRRSARTPAEESERQSRIDEGETAQTTPTTLSDAERAEWEADNAAANTAAASSSSSAAAAAASSSSSSAAASPAVPSRSRSSLAAAASSPALPVRSSSSGHRSPAAATRSHTAMISRTASRSHMQIVGQPLALAPAQPARAPSSLERIRVASPAVAAAAAAAASSPSSPSPSPPALPLASDARSSSSAGVDPACSICLDPVLHDATSLDGCRHMFCYDCIHQWCTRISSTCPLCKAPVHALSHMGAAADEDEDDDVQMIPSFAAAAAAAAAPSSSPGAPIVVPIAEKLQRVTWEMDELELLPEEVRNARCRLCERDDHEDQLLLCDGCEHGAAHTYCLGMDEVPDSDWFCDSCTTERTKRRRLQRMRDTERERERERAPRPSAAAAWSAVPASASRVRGRHHLARGVPSGSSLASLPAPSPTEDFISRLAAQLAGYKVPAAKPSSAAAALRLPSAAVAAAGSPPSHRGPGWEARALIQKRREKRQHQHEREEKKSQQAWEARVSAERATVGASRPAAFAAAASSSPAAAAGAAPIRRRLIKKVDPDSEPISMRMTSTPSSPELGPIAHPQLQSSPVLPTVSAVALAFGNSPRKIVPPAAATSAPRPIVAGPRPIVQVPRPVVSGPRPIVPAPRGSPPALSSPSPAAASSAVAWPTQSQPSAPRPLLASPAAAAAPSGAARFFPPPLATAAATVPAAAAASPLASAASLLPAMPSFVDFESMHAHSSRHSSHRHESKEQRHRSSEHRSKHGQHTDKPHRSSHAHHEREHKRDKERSQPSEGGASGQPTDPRSQHSSGHKRSREERG